MADDELTPRQRECLDFIRAYLLEKGYPPTIREIGVALKGEGRRGALQSQAVIDNLYALQRKGYLQREPGSRCLRLCRPLQTDEQIVTLFAEAFESLPPTLQKAIRHRIRSR